MNESLRPTRLEIDLTQIAANTRLLRAHVPERAALMAVIKADAYGHGAAEVARTALSNGATWLGVALVEEGARLREAGVDAPILVLGGISQAGAEAVVGYGLTQAVFDVQAIEWLEAAATRHGTVVDVHLKVDSGMGRIGVHTEAAFHEMVNVALAAEHVRLTGVFTHFAMADEKDPAFTQAQAARFTSLVAALRQIRPNVLAHAANSAALLRYPALSFDMVRAGIALYMDPCLPENGGKGLGVAMRWVTHGVQVKEIAPGDTVGYGCRFTAQRPTKVMTLPVGYADGYHRCIGGRGRVLVRGKSVPVIGRVCMDQTMVDVTDVPGAAVGDEAVLLGRQGDEWISVREMGEWCGMIDYEVLLSPTGRVPRIYVP